MKSAAHTADANAAPRENALAPAPDGRAQPACVRSRDLLGLAGEIRIEHAGALYTLRETSKGKLILTK